MRYTSIRTDSGTSVHDITDAVNACLAGTAGSTCVISIPHTTAAVTVLTNEEHVADDTITMFKALLPRDTRTKHASLDHVAAHFYSALVGTSLALPIENARVKLGQYQRLVLIDFEGPSERTIEVVC